MSTLEDCLRDLNDLSGYASDSRYVPGFGDDGVNTDMSNIIVVENLPVVPEAKFPKLLEFVKRIYSAIGEIAEDGVQMPMNASTGSTEGFAFVEFKATADASKAVAQTNNWDFDKSHKLTVMRYDQFQEYQRVPETFVPPPVAEATHQPDRYYWLQDEHFRDEFVIRYSNSDKASGSAGEREKHETEVLWAEMRGPPALDYGGEKQKSMGLQWTNSLVAWSPQGSYLLTMHPQGAKLWSGKGFREGLRLLHAGVNAVLWSPDESFVATWNGRIGNDPVEAREALVVWDVRTGARVRAFAQRRIQDAEPDFGWSADSKYLARVDFDKDTGVELLRIYEAPSFGLLDNRSVKAAGARDLSWCPRRHNLLAYWTPERENAPTTVYVMRVPSKEYVRIRPLQNVESVQLEWHPQGDFLAVISEKLTKGQARKKKAGDKGGSGMPVPGAKATTAGFSVELFRLRTKDVPIEVLDIKERVFAFAFEPVGNRFAILQGESAAKLTVAFYAMPDKGAPTHLFNVEDRTLNTLHWSPRGEVIIFAGLASNQGSLEFYDVERRKTLNTTSHDVANDLAWDPAGRMVATLKTQYIGGASLTRDTVGNGYTLWTFQGTKITEVTKPKMFQFLWRPRIEGLLTDDETKDVAKNLKKFIGRYLDEDKQRQGRKDLLARLRKRKARDDFRAFLAERAAEWDANRPLRIEAGIEPEDAAEVVTYEDVYEVAVSEEVTVVV